MNFGFEAEEFKGTLNVVPYAQILNPTRSINWGMAIKESQAEIANFSGDKNWMLTPHTFGEGSTENILLSTNPRMLVLNKSGLLLQKNTGEIEPYSLALKGQGKVFSYFVVWFLSADNEPISLSPFRLKLSGQAGVTFRKNFISSGDCFCSRLARAYAQASGDKSSKNELFYSHSIYIPKLGRGKATNAQGQSSPACLTEGFELPSEKTLKEFLIPGNSILSQKIRELHQETKTWIKLERVQEEYSEVSEVSEVAPSYPTNLDDIPY